MGCDQGKELFLMQSSKKPEPNGICRSGCPTQDHKSYGDCIKDANLSIDRTSLRVK